MYALILLATVTIADYEYHRALGGAGIDVEVERFETLAQCEQARQTFLKGMTVTSKELLANDSSARNIESKIHREAKCVKL